MRIAINGFGRIGRSFFRQAWEDPSINIVALNDLGSFHNLAHLLSFDTVYRAYNKKVYVQPSSPEIELPSREVDGTNAKGKLTIDDKEVLFFQEADPKNLPWKKLKIDVVIEATGHFADYTKAKAHLEAGAKKVIITAPAKGEEGKDGRTVLLGINEKERDNFSIISNGSCTTNAVAPVIEVLKEKIGVEKAILNTVHAYTSTQSLVDGSCEKDWRRGRAASNNIVPSTTGAAKCVGKVIPDLENKFDGIALRVPVICGSIADITFVASRKTTREEINEIFINVSKEERWKDILGVSNVPVVSSDFIKVTTPAVVDLDFTQVVDDDLVKVLVWYDNEWGYSWTLVQQIKKLKI